jgi:uncharacterized protein (DUF2147 family)
MKKYLMLLIALFSLIAVSQAQSHVEGKWKTIDDETGKMKSIVELKVKNGKLYGTIVALSPDSDPNKVCTECTDHRKGKKIVGMEIISGLKQDDSVWEGDDGILDPENGKLYDCKIWVEDGKLQVRGYIGFLFRTQTWVKA